tara:strand:- start:2366 stop:3208 length:843 start_codon:yes stop_codon:yes gene_type:complete
MNDAIELYNKTSLDCSEIITKNYSTSFSLGIKSLSSSIQKPIYAIYGYVRFADEIVDTFHDHDKETILSIFKKDTEEAIKNKFSTNPILHSFQMVVHEFKIDRNLIDAFLKSMHMDIIKNTYSESEYKEYIFGSAEVIGLMCLKVFCNNKKQYDELINYAMSLGSAFQKINFLRDIKSDYDERGRIYFPEIDFNNFNESDKKSIEENINIDFNNALTGIKKLPKKAKRGVFLAYAYYKKLFSKIKNIRSSKLKNSRIRISNFYKFILYLSSRFKLIIGII